MPGYFENIKAAFSSKPATPPAPQQTTPPVDPNQPNVQGGGNPGSNPTNQKVPPVNPGNWYEQLYTNTNTGEEDTPPEFKLDGTKLQEVAGGQNFGVSLSDEDKAKLAAGDFSVLEGMMNKVGQNAYKAALEHGSTLTGKFVGARSDYESKKLGSRVKETQVDQELSGLPNYSNPAVKAHLNDIAKRLQQQHPDATPREVALEAQRLLMEIAKGVDPENTPEAKARTKPGETDFMKWLGVEESNQS